MEEKNKASEMLHQMKKYIRASGTPEKVAPAPEQVTEAESDAFGEAELIDSAVEQTAEAVEAEPTESQETIKEPTETVTEKVPVQPKKEKVRKLPVDEALFEFDEIAFDDVLVPEPEPLTPEQAVYADEIREKFGVSSSVGIAFISEEPTEAKTVFAPPVNEDEAEQEQADDADFEDGAEENGLEIEAEAEPESDSESKPEYEAEPESEPEIEFEEQALSEDDAEPVEQIGLDEEIHVVPTEDDEPEQVVFGIEDDEPKEKPAPVRNDVYTSSGVQLTFLDADEDDFYEEEPEQIAFDEAVTEDASEEDDFDVFDGAEDEIEDEQAVVLDTENTFAVSDEGESDVDAQFTEPVAEEEAIQTAIDESDADFENEEAEQVQEVNEPLTALEINAIEQEQLVAEPELESVIPIEPANDIWDDADRPLYEAKKKYLEFCDGLIVPPLRTSKESPVAPITESPASSGYRYAGTERLPLFADGKNGGRNTEGYKNREMEYCADREEKRSAKMLERLRVSSRRLMFCALIMLAVIITENIGVFFSVNPDGLLIATGPMLFGIIDSVLLIIGAIMIYDSIGIGIKRILSGTFTLESLTACIVLPAIAYHLIIAFAGVGSEFTMLFGTAAAISVFLTALYRYNNVKRDYASFTVTASYGDYLTECELADYMNTPEGEAFGDYMDEDASLYRLNRVARIDACYTDKDVNDECFGIIRKLMLCIISVAVIAGVVFGILRNDAVYGVLSAISLVSFACPVSAFVAVSLPKLRASTVAGESGGAIVGLDDEDNEYDESIIMLEDGDLFPANYLSSSNFEIYSSSVEAHLARTLALFKKIGGPIAVVFNNVEGTVDNFESIRITEITEQGIQARIDGRPICAGSESFMKRMGINISKYDKLLPKNGRVMYIADDGVFFARLILVFKPDSELVHKIAALRNTNTVFSLKTCNPCIDKELLFYTTGLEPELLKLVKYKVGDDTATARTDREGGLVSCNGAKGLLTALLEYKRQKALLRNASVFACAACVIGAFVSLLISAIKINFGFSSLVALALHGGLSLVAFLLSRRKAIDTKTKIKKK